MKKVYFRTYSLMIFLALYGHFLSAQTTNDYRSSASGTWNTLATWQTFNGSVWVAATSVPTSTCGVITIQSPNTVSVSAAVTIDQAVVNNGGILMWTAGALTIANGAGVDLQVDGTFIDSTTTAIAFSASASWQLGASGTFRKCQSGSTANWHSFYQGGSSMASIPATSNWRVVRRGATLPSFSNVGITYGNLTFENYFATALTITANGSTGFMTIKGNLDVGGNGTTVVTLNNTNTNVNPTLVMGSMTVRGARIYTGSGTGITIQGGLTVSGTYNNNGTAITTVQGNTSVTGLLSNLSSLNLQGDLSVNGSLTYSGTGNSLNFTGANSQSISGAGTLQVYKSTINKSANDLTLNRPVTIDNVLTLTLGKIISTTTNLLTINNNGSAMVTSPTTNNSFVSGPIRKDGTSGGFTFPVGKVSNYQPLTVSTTTGGSFGTFWTEDFGTGTCASSRGTRVSSYTGSNGAWGETITTDGGAANTFYVSPTEAGMGAGACGNGCLSNAALTNKSLHIANQSTSPAAFFFCPAGDCGAAYDAGLIDGTVLTDRRAESPVIDCSTHSNIQLSFSYLEGGQGASDNGQVWYFDGTTWTLLDDLVKSPAGSCGAQGTWTAYSISLPASANSNPNVKIGFRWINNDDGAGNDPSFAIDDVTLAETAPPESFTCEYFPSDPQLAWGTAKDVTIADITPYEYWVLDRNIGTASKLVTLAWDNASSITTPASTQVIKWDGAQWKDQTNGGITGVASNDPTCISQSVCGTIVSGVYVPSFSPFTFGIPLVSLPIELLDISAELEGNKADVKWTTATEKNTDYFIVEKSDNGIDFNEMGQTKAAGNSTSVKKYKLYDNNLSEGITYYRLKSIDLDDAYTHSKIVSVEYTLTDQTVRLFPNPTNSKLYVNALSVSQLKDIKITDVSGLQLKSEIVQYNNTTYEISMEHLSEGIYFIEFMYKNKKRTEKVIKN